MQELSKTIYTLMTRGHLLPWWIDHKPLVEYGIARFLKKESEHEVAIEEPLAVISIIQYFRSNGYTPSSSYVLPAFSWLVRHTEYTTAIPLFQEGIYGTLRHQEPRQMKG